MRAYASKHKRPGPSVPHCLHERERERERKIVHSPLHVHACNNRSLRFQLKFGIK